MANIRVYQLAKELEVDSKQLMAELNKRGVETTTHMNAIEHSVADELRAYYNRRGESSGAAQGGARGKTENATAVATPPPAKPAKKTAAQAVPTVRVIPKKSKVRAEPQVGLPPKKSAVAAMPAVTPKTKPGTVAVPRKKVPMKGQPAVEGIPISSMPVVEPAAHVAPAPIEEPVEEMIEQSLEQVGEAATVEAPPADEPPVEEAPVVEADVTVETPAAPPEDATMTPPVVEPKPKKPTGKPAKKAAKKTAPPLFENQLTKSPIVSPVLPESTAKPAKKRRKQAKQKLPAAPTSPRLRKGKPVSPMPLAAQVAPVAAPEQPVEETGPKKVVIGEAVTVKDLAEMLNVKSNEIIMQLLEMGIMSTINQIVDTDAALQVARKFALEAEVVSVSIEDLDIEVEEETEEWEPRPPVVTVMGHVDHGKTKLLDAIRRTNVVDSEFGGITQHIGAYSVKTDRGVVTFLDTPGHEAFTAMRARGAYVTDLVVLVVAADDGVMPQTREAIAHARAAGAPIVVAVNKIDKEGANPERVKNDLSEMNLMPEAWGGDTIFCEVSATELIGIDALLEMIILQAEILELKANPRRTVKGVVIEAKLDKSMGAVATVLVQHGTLRVSDAFVCGLHAGRVRALLDEHGKRVREVGPSMPVEVLGMTGVPNAGDVFVGVQDERRARQIARTRAERQRVEGMAKSARVQLEDLFDQIQQGEVKDLNIVLKADVQGSAEVLASSFEKLGNEEVRVKIIHSSVGGITDSDVLLSSASNAIIIGFNVRPIPSAERLAMRENIDINLYTVIYEAVSSVKLGLEGMLAPRLKEVTLGRAEVREVFNIQKIGTVAGCYMQEGLARRDSQARLIRDNVPVYEGKVGSLRRFKEDVREVANGFECGVSIEKFNDIKAQDIIEFYFIKEEARTL